MKSLAELKKVQEKNRSAIILPEGGNEIRIVVGMATCGIAAGARPVFDALEAGIKENALGKQVSLIQTGCVGVCQYEPVIEIYQAGKERVTYVKMTAEKAAKVLEQHIMGGKVVEEYTITYAQNGGKAPADGKVHTSLTETDFCKTQLRQALRNCGLINPESIDEYIAMDGYKALGKALTEMTPDQVIETVLASGLRGRGGAGFPTGMKWKFASGNRGNVQKYVCCNADEGDPGAFMDRSVLEGDPHAVVEAMAIAGYAIGADQGYVYVRAEYPVAVKRLQIAIDQAKKYGLLGKNIFGTDFSFDLDIRLGAGAFVCGEETALMTSIEGKRGEPRPRPPFPAIKGLFASPTILNNVETYANIPQIILNGAEWFSSVGTEKSKGTKVFALGGKIKNTGLVEVPMGTTLRHIIEEIGGGIPNGKKFKAAQTGGPSGGCIPAHLIDTQIDYDNLIAIGSMMGSGGLIVMDEDTCMVDLARFFLDFTVDESCGKCTPCRVGTRRLLEILDKIISGNGEMEDLDRLEELATYIKSASLCGLGQTAPNPVLSTMRYFRDEYIAHIVDKKCPAGVCKKLIRYEIDPEKCIGCGMCAKNCPASTIVRTDYTAPGHKLASMKIEQANCVKCGACMTNCKFGAITKG
ncbi:MAG: NADH-quinone oxidoreductase subunit NuoF [Ruminococcaceae bacterium]|nr:NADH-quinone oxidoreductase subunit NuoF [Oscillospiraceae bacterium]